MKKFAVFTFVLVFIIACKKDTIDNYFPDSSESNLLKSGKAKKIEVCHFSEDENTWHLITISENAWSAHEMHGDVRLDDQDGDGFVPNNECGYGNMGDDDDNDSSVYPGGPGSGSGIDITNIRLGGQIGDTYVGPSCTGSGFYVTSFYITGTGLPTSRNDYSIQINNIAYSIFFLRVLSDNEIVIGVNSLPSGEVGVDISIQIQSDYIFNFTDVYDAPVCD